MIEPRSDRDLLYGEVTDAILAELHAGRNPDVAALAQRYPALAHELEAHVSQLAAILRCAFGRGESEDQLPRLLGDFLLLREVGRGGMGIVYEAEQCSLKRRVALKVLPSAALLEPRRLERFLNEAHAAAQLQHPHIVPVFAVGCEDGLHYYAMPLIEGRSLAAVIQDLRRPGDPPAPGQTAPTRSVTEVPRPDASVPFAPASVRREAALKWGVQAAEALQYAHEVGVIHRDIKPANLLVDERNEIWVTDFGLARLRGESDVTATGDVVGTLRYMSPEQALGAKGVVDHRADIYGLGATLYELLTLVPVLPGDGRAELLRRLTNEDPRPPRTLDPTVPVDLETVVLKALRKEPAERYATAQELADDLRRVLEGRPVLACRPTLRQRATKWARRHAVGLTIAGCMLLVISTVLAVSTVMTVEAYREAANKNAQAEARLRLTLQAVDDMYTKVAEKWLASQPNQEPLQREFLLKALDIYEQLLREAPDDPELAFQLALAHGRVGEIRTRLMEHARAEESFREAIRRLERLPEGAADAYQQRLAVARGYYHLGKLLTDMDRVGEAEPVLRRAAELAAELDEQKFPARPQCRRLRAMVHQSLFALFNQSGRHDEAEREVQQERKQREALVSDEASPENWAGLGACLRRTAIIHIGREELSTAHDLLTKAADFHCKALGARPDLVDARESLSHCYALLGNVYSLKNKALQAVAEHDKSFQIRKQLAGDFPNTPHYQRLAAAALAAKGEELASPRMYATGKAREAFEEAVKYQRAVTGRPDALPLDHCVLGIIRYGLAQTTFDTEGWQKAKPILEDAIGCHERGLQPNPQNPRFVWELRRCHVLNANLLVKVSDYEAALGVADQLLRNLSKFGESVDTLNDVATILRLCMDVDADETVPAEQRQGRVEQIIIKLRDVCGRAEKLANNQHGRTLVAQIQAYLAQILTGRPGDLAQAIDLAEKAAKAVPSAWQMCNTLGAARYRAGDYQGAKNAVAISLWRSGGQNSWNWFVLAMACGKLGEGEAARAAYALGWDWWSKRASGDPGLCRLGCEAADLLGVGDREGTLRPRSKWPPPPTGKARPEK